MIGPLPSRLISAPTTPPWLPLPQPHGLAAVPGTDLICFHLRAFRFASHGLPSLPGNSYPALHWTQPFMDNFPWVTSSEPFTPHSIASYSALVVKRLPLSDVIFDACLLKCRTSGSTCLVPWKIPKALSSSWHRTLSKYLWSEWLSKCIMKIYAWLGRLCFVL